MYVAFALEKSIQQANQGNGLGIYNAAIDLILSIL
jgi:hypothetical protein